MANYGFKEITGFSGYFVNSTGEVKGKRVGVLKAGSDKRGYLKVWLYSNGKRSEKYIHRLVAENFVPGDMSLTVNHIDGNKLNNSSDNLEWVSNSDNLRHSFDSGLRDTKKAWSTRRKKDHGLTSADSKTQKAICEDFKNKSLTRIQLAERYGIHRKTVSTILKLHKVA